MPSGLILSRCISISSCLSCIQQLLPSGVLLLLLRLGPDGPGLVMQAAKRQTLDMQERSQCQVRCYGIVGGQPTCKCLQRLPCRILAEPKRTCFGSKPAMISCLWVSETQLQGVEVSSTAQCPRTYPQLCLLSGLRYHPACCSGFATSMSTD